MGVVFQIIKSEGKIINDFDGFNEYCCVLRFRSKLGRFMAGLTLSMSCNYSIFKQGNELGWFFKKYFPRATMITYFIVSWRINMGENTSICDMRLMCCYDYYNGERVGVNQKNSSEVNPAESSPNNYLARMNDGHYPRLFFNSNLMMAGSLYGPEASASFNAKIKKMIKDIIDPPHKKGVPGKTHDSGKEFIEGNRKIKEDAEAAKDNKASSEYSEIDFNFAVPENYLATDVSSRGHINRGADLKEGWLSKTELILKCIVGSLLLIAGFRVLPGASLEPVLPSIAGAGVYVDPNAGGPSQIL